MVGELRDTNHTVQQKRKKKKTEDNERNARSEEGMIPLQKVTGSLLAVESFQLDAE